MMGKGAETMGAPDVRPTMSEIRRRLNLVERAIHERGWSTALARELAEQLGVDVRSVYRYRSQVLEDIKEAISVEDRETQRAEFVDRVRRYQSIAREDRAWGALSSMLNCEAKVLGIEAPQKHEHTIGRSQAMQLSADELDRFAHYESRMAELREKRDAGTLTTMERHALDVFQDGLVGQ